MLAIELDKLWCLPLDVALTPRSGACIVDSWWVIHPKQGIVLYTAHGTTKSSRRPMFCSPQCNSNRQITEHFVKDMYPFAEVRHLPVVYLRAGDGYLLPAEAVPCEVTS